MARKLNKKIINKIERITGDLRTLAETLRTFSEDQEAIFEERTERYQESEKGEAFMAWYELIAEKADEAEAVTDALETEDYYEPEA